MKSEMPSYKEMYNQYLMKMIRIPLLESFSIGVYDSFIDDLSYDTSIQLEVFKIADKRIKGCVPNKVWWDDAAQQWQFLFYATEAIAQEDRPLKGNYSCVAILDSTLYDSIGYHVESKLLIDQIRGQDNNMYYIIMFSESSLKDILKDYQSA